MMMMDSSGMTLEGVVEEIMKLHRSLPARPGIDEVEAAKTLIRNVEREDELKLEGISKQSKNKNVPEELFMILQEMQRNIISFQSKERKEEALKLLDLESVHQLFDEMVQRACKCLPGYSETMKSSSNSLSSTVTNPTTIVASSASASSKLYDEREENTKPVSEVMMFSKDDSYVKKPKTTFLSDGIRSKEFSTVDPTLKPVVSSGREGEKMSLIKLASLIEVSAKKGVKELLLQGKLSDQIEWLPDSIRKLASLTKLDLSENRIVVLPDTIGELSSLQILDLHGNKINELPESIGGLLNLLHLDLRGNQLKSLPPTISRLVHLQELDLSSNGLSVLPETIGSLISLKKLNVEMNDIDEIPHTISQCTSLKELHADYNRLKALPEAVGRIGSLEILTLRYNNVKQLPTTMASMLSLRELNISFNELESVPESLCFATTLVKLNVSNNFADLQYLPRSIGNLEMLEELDICNNQIRVLPDSFRMLTRLRVLKVEGNPLAVPPRDVIEKGPQAVVQYMADLAAQRDVKSHPVKQKKSWAQMCCFSKSNKRKRNGVDYAKTI
ncbi:hypothetical protein ACJIZ3_002446 [Penstemon smallii]|uniref:Disease resistance R13L4/SHOC-2-like LRR domain-containing protein n=1 Tax=Penstemon smallii TaxID=265156 RepID=A0ABD3UA70_9LAMI